ncbi:MAG TPA: hypothetical protein VLD62_03310 [Acidimicrobiia bacterium]|nr:hypothetical protein [Acidimicrobiia bacterium]
MKGDIIIVEEHHRSAGRIIAERLAPGVEERGRRTTITVAGESGSGKSETATAIAEELAPYGISAAILQQDDYFIHPPKTNDRTRRANICWVGPTEVQLDLLDGHLEAARSGAGDVTKPLVLYGEDRVVEEVMDISNAQVVIAEGTYTSLLENVDTRVFIARNRLETMAHRQKRGREQFDPFIEEVLKIEHEIISKHIERADVVISRDFEVSFLGD